MKILNEFSIKIDLALVWENAWILRYCHLWTEKCSFLGEYHWVYPSIDFTSGEWNALHLLAIFPQTIWLVMTQEITGKWRRCCQYPIFIRDAAEPTFVHYSQRIVINYVGTNRKVASAPKRNIASVVVVIQQIVSWQPCQIRLPL